MNWTGTHIVVNDISMAHLFSKLGLLLFPSELLIVFGWRYEVITFLTIVLVFRQDGELNFREHLYRQRTSDNKRPQNCWLIAPNFQKGKLSPRKVKLCAQVFTAHTLHIWCLVGHFFRCFWYVCVCARVRVRTQLLNQVWSLVTLWTIAHQVPQSVGFLRWEY